jgi:hypothetical protein
LGPKTAVVGPLVFGLLHTNHRTFVLRVGTGIGTRESPCESSDPSAVSVIDEKLSTQARPSGGPSETACAANMLTNKTMIKKEE